MTPSAALNSDIGLCQIDENPRKVYIFLYKNSGFYEAAFRIINCQTYSGHIDGKACW